MTQNVQRGVMSAIGAAALAVMLVICGFVVCASFPQITQTLSSATCNEEDSPFSRDELVTAAVATRAYTIENNDRVALLETIAAINDEASTPFAGVSAEELEAAPDAYTLTPDALSHLDDVNAVVKRVVPAFIGVAALAAFCLMVVMRTWGARAFGRPLIWAGVAVVAVFAVLGSWAAIDFNGLFAVFHGLFFADGTWTFPSDSLLICMYPETFWQGMGAVWLAVTLVLSAAAIISGAFLVKRGSKASAAERLAKARERLIVENWLDDVEEEKDNPNIIENWLDDEDDEESPSRALDSAADGDQDKGSAGMRR